jgi:hypothetical protein
LRRAGCAPDDRGGRFVEPHARSEMCERL